MADSLQAEQSLEEKICSGLLKEGFITKSQLEKARKIEADSEKNIGQVLVEQGLLTVEDIREFIVEKMEIPNVDLSSYTPDPEALEMIPPEVIREYKLLPLFEIEGLLTVAIANPIEVFSLDFIGQQFNIEIEPVLGDEKDLIKAINQAYSGNADKELLTEAVIKTTKEEKVKEKKEAIKEEEIKEEEIKEETKVVEEEEIEEEIKVPEIELERLAIADEETIDSIIGEIIQKAIEANASYVHIEPMKEEFTLYFRISNSLVKIASASVNLRKGLVASIYSMAYLNPDEKVYPQEGIIRSRLGEREILLKVQTFPTNKGNRIVIKIDHQPRKIRSLNELGLSQDDLGKFKGLLDPSKAGLVLLSGPAGSGRTETFYAALNYLNTGEYNIFSLENIIQNDIDGINQVALNNYELNNLSQIMRSIINQDIDVLGFDEITDLGAAEQVVHAALNGVMVIATFLGANSIQAITRLMELGLEPLSLSFSLKGVTAQRLVRINCQNCKKEYKSDLLSEESSKVKDLKLFKGEGCPECNRTGFKDFSGIFEVLEIEDKLKTVIATRALEDEIKKAIPKDKMKNLAENGLNRALKGETTIEEIARLTRIKRK